MAWEARLRLGTARPSDGVGSSPGLGEGVEGESEEPSVEGFAGKKHLKIPSACHFVACLKFTQTSMRPGRLSAGSRRSM